MSTLTISNNQAIIFGQINISKMSPHSELALSQFVFNHNIHLLAVQETGHWDPDCKLFANYTIFVNTNSPTSSLSGVGLIVKNCLQPEAVKVLQSDDSDTIWCQIFVNGQRHLLGSIYCRPQTSSTSPTAPSNDLSSISENIKEALRFAKENNISSVRVYGDFNSRHKDWGDTVTSPRGRSLAKFLDEEDMTVSCPYEKTFVCDNGGSVIDLVISKGKLDNYVTPQWLEKDVELFSGAPRRGHYPVLHHVKTDGRNENSQQIKKQYNWDKANWDEWTSHVETKCQAILEDANYNGNLSKLWDNFIHILQSANSSCIPKKRLSIHSKPYWNKELSTLSLKLQQLRQKFRSRATQSNRAALAETTERFKERLNVYKNDWVHEKAESLNIKQSTTFWKRYKGVFGVQPNNTINNLVYNDDFIHTSKGKEELLYKTYFTGKHLEDQGRGISQEYESNVMKKYAEALKDQPTSKESCNGNNEILNARIEIWELESSIRNQKDAKSLDPDQIHPSILRHLGLQAKKVLLTCFNLSLESSEWVWNKSDVIFIRKADKSSYSTPGSYRPLSLASYLGKVFERILDNRLRKFIQIEGKLDEEQEGFCAGRSTVRYLFRMLANLSEIKRKKLSCMILFLDFQKAFDSVYIPLLITKLHKLEITGKMLGIINTFLISRVISLKVNNYSGPYRKCGWYGLPQGSVLSPFLFILYISDMLDDLPKDERANINCYKFADDGSIVAFHEDSVECRAIMQRICDHLGQWCRQNMLVLNCDKNKTEAMILETECQRDVSPPQLVIDGRKIHYVEHTKVLGIFIDKDLSFKHHATEKLKHCKQVWNLIKRGTTRDRGLNTRSITYILKVVVLTKLLYGSMLWLHNNLDTFRSFWNEIILKCSGSMFYPHREITEIALQLPPLDVQLEVITVKFLCKCLSGNDFMNSLVLQADGSLHNIFHNHMRSLRDFLAWKMGIRSARNIDLAGSSNNNAACYSKEEMTRYTSHIWLARAKNICLVKKKELER